MAKMSFSQRFPHFGIIMVLAVLVAIPLTVWSLNNASTQIVQEASPKPYVEPGCKIDGCNNELCMNESDTSPATPCYYNQTFSCYKNAKCEKQTNGQCGWTQTNQLLNCLKKNPTPTPTVSPAPQISCYKVGGTCVTTLTSNAGTTIVCPQGTTLSNIYSCDLGSYCCLPTRQ